MEILDLERIRSGFPGITPTLGETLLEACLVCLEKLNHAPGTVLNVFGDWNVDLELQWTTLVDERMRRAWGNRNETTEFAAVCLIALLVEHLTPYVVLERANDDTGIDYWLMSKSTPTEEKVTGRLEISGIFSGTPAQINQRFRLKLIQSEQSDDTNLPAIIGIAEFSKPQTRLEGKNEQYKY